MKRPILTPAYRWLKAGEQLHATDTLWDGRAWYTVAHYIGKVLTPDIEFTKNRARELITKGVRRAVSS